MTGPGGADGAAGQLGADAAGRAGADAVGQLGADAVGPARRRRNPRGSGDQLREEILDAATGLLLASGHEKAVSIRAVAQRVGVTAPSIYLHFADKDALLDAVCARYFERLDEQMQRAGDGQSHPLEVLRAQGLAYVRFAAANPELYRIATMGEARPGSDSDAALASSAFTHLRDSVQALMDAGIYPPGDTTEATLELWAAAHGVVALAVSKPYLPFGELMAFADRVLVAVCAGRIVLGEVGEDARPEDFLTWLAEARGKMVR